MMEQKFDKRICLRCVQEQCYPEMTLDDIENLPELKDWEGGCVACPPNDEKEQFPPTWCRFYLEQVLSQQNG